MSVKTRWYVVANRASAVIYANGSPNQKFRFVDRILNPEGELSGRDLDSDRPGRGFSSASSPSIRHSLEKKMNRHEAVALRFAKELGQILDKALREERFGQLVLVAEPHFLGLLRESLPSAVSRAVRHEVHHEYEGSDDEIRDKILRAIESGT